jgi:hypothetical protein
MKKIIDTIEKDNETLTVWHCDTLINAPPLELIVECYLEILRSGLAYPGIPIRNGSNVIWIENSKAEVMAGQVYEYLEERKEGWIMMGFTDKKFRKLGLNQLCHKYLIEKVKQRGGISLGSTISVHNEKMLAAAKQKGLTTEFYRTIQWI